MRCLLLALCLSACASSPVPVTPETEQECFAPWEIEPYKSGRAIPAPGVDGIIIPLCEFPDE